MRTTSETETAVHALMAAQDPILAYDGGGRVVFANPAAAELFDLPTEALLGVHVRQLLPDLDDRDATAHEQVAYRGDGTTCPVEASVGRAVRGGRLQSTVVLRDITTRMAADRLRDEFVSLVSHELRTPLTSIRGSLSLLVSGVVGPLADAAKELVSIANENANRLIRLINHILDLDKLEAGRMELVVRDIRAVELLEKVRDDFDGLVRERGLSLNITSQADSPLVRGDWDRLVQVMTNLFGNAVKYSPPGGRIDVIVRRLHGQVEIAVSDQGPGVPPDQRERVFLRFHQADSSDTRAKEGTGLGLAISRAIVRQLGGSIGVDDAPGGGARFYLRLPNPQASLSTGSGAGQLEAGGKYDILLAADEPENARTLRSRIEALGYVVRWAPNTAKARFGLALTKPKAIVLDPRLESGAGLGLIDDYAAMARETDGRIVVVTDAPLDPARRRLPVVSAWLPMDPAPPELSRAIRRAVRRPGAARLLLVNDDTGIQAVLRAQLEALEATAEQARTAEEAVEALERVDPDLVVLDPGLAGTDTKALVAAVRLTRWRATPLILFPSADLSEQDRRALSLGDTLAISRAPGDEDDLSRAITTLLGELVSPV